MKFLFFIRKFLISFEFVCILIGIMAYMLFSEELDINLSRMQINPDTVKFVVTIPMIISFISLFKNYNNENAYEILNKRIDSLVYELKIKK